LSTKTENPERLSPRLERERKTLEAMIGLYCRDRHGIRDGLCPDCAELAEYARQRLLKCPFGEGKTTCAKCPVHCYRPAMRERIRQVMRHAGPRMPYRHPLMTLRHWMDGLRKEPRRRKPGPPTADATVRPSGSGKASSTAQPEPGTNGGKAKTADGALGEDP